MRVKRPLHLIVALAFYATAACDKDPSNPVVSFRVAGCPTSSGVNDALTLTFTGGQPLAGTITGQNVVVSNAVTGVELPGSLSSNSTGGVVFTPAQPLPFGTRVRVRVQNIRAQNSNAPVELFVCEFTTAPPPISELFWNRVSDAGGRPLFGGALVAPDSGFVISQTSILYKRLGGDFGVAYSSPYALSGFDVNFVNKQQGFVSIFEPRLRQSTILETVDGGFVFDTIASTPFRSAIRLFFRAAPGLSGVPATPPAVFGIVGAGTSTSATFYKWRPQTRTLTEQLTVGNVGGVLDVSFATDTVRGVGVGGGLKSGSVQTRGKVWVTINGGSTWTEVANAAANNTSVAYNGVAMRNNGDIYVAGSGGYFLRLTGTAPGPYTVTRIELNQLQPNSGPGRLVNSDETNPNALIFSDVEFALDNDLRGWVVGGELLTNPGSEPRYQGFIYRTTDGGTTWVRQGVRGAAKFGADMPRLRRLSVLNQNNVWIVGDGGAVLTYRP